jgi:hypothetical protein
VTSAEACLSVVILTEDSGKDGRATIEALARRMFELLVPGFGSHRVDFLPREPREEEAMRGNVWKTDGKNPQEHERRVRLLRYLARRLLQPDTFVLFHIDGDRPWGEHPTSENTAKFEKLVRGALPQVVARGRANAPKGRSHTEAEPSPVLPVEHLLLICPFRSVEAWLYQNVRIAVDICRREHRGHHVTDLEAWEARREQLDELPAPEKAVCLAKEHNLELATRGFPAQETYDVGKSLAATVDRLLECSAFTRALERTRGWS